MNTRTRDERLQLWYRQARIGLFVHWGMLTGEHVADPSGPNLRFPYETPEAFEAATAEWRAERWVATAKRLRAQYLTIAAFHCDLGYLKLWPSRVPGSPGTRRDYLKELIDAATPEGVRILVYITRAANHAIYGGVQWLDRAAYGRYKRDDTVDITTSPGFLVYTMDVINELLDTHPGIAGFWFDGYNDSQEAQAVFAQVHRLRDDLILVRNDFGHGPVDDEDAMSLEDWGKVCDPEFDFASAAWVGPGDKEFAFKTKGDWFYLGEGRPDWSNYELNYAREPQNATIVRRILTIAGSSWNSHLGYGPKIGGDFPEPLENFTEHFDRFMSWAHESIYGTVGGGYGDGGLSPGWWNDGAYGVTTVVPGQGIQYLHVLRAPLGRHLALPDAGYAITGAWNLKSGQALPWEQVRGWLTVEVSSWDSVEQDGALIVKLTTGARRMVPPRDISVSACSEVPEHPAANLLNGDYRSYFQTADGPWPKSLTMHLANPCEAAGLCLTQPETGPVRSGGYAAPVSERIREYEVHVSRDGRQWGEPVASGELSNRRGLQVVVFDPVPASYLRFTARSNYGGTGALKLISMDVMIPGSSP